MLTLKAGLSSWINERSLKITFKNVCWIAYERQVYKNAKTHNVYYRCLCFIFDWSSNFLVCWKVLWYPAHPDRVVLLINYHQSCLCGYFKISRIQEPIPDALHCMGFFGGLIFAPIRSCPSLVIRSTPFLGNVYLRYLSGHLLLASL